MTRIADRRSCLMGGTWAAPNFIQIRPTRPALYWKTLVSIQTRNNHETMMRVEKASVAASPGSPLWPCGDV